MPAPMSRKLAAKAIKRRKQAANQRKRRNALVPIATLTQELHSSSDSEFEGTAGYRNGGYHPVRLGEVYNGRYVVERKLGWGHFSTVWLVSDLHAQRRGEFPEPMSGEAIRERAEQGDAGDMQPFWLALKVQKSAEHYTEAAEDEIKLLRDAAKAASSPSENRVVRLYDHFTTSGVNGNHVCMVFEVLGNHLLDYIKAYKYKGLPLDLVKSLTKDLLLSLVQLHDRAKIIHTDLKPENILLKRTQGFDLRALRRQRRQVLEREKKLLGRHAPGAGSGPTESDLPETLQSATSIAEEADETSVESVRLYVEVWRKLQEPGLNKNQKKRLKQRSKKLRERVESEGLTVPDLDTADAADDMTNATSRESEDESRRKELVYQYDDTNWESREYPVAMLADLGNACWIHKHFTDDITTRQYRSPEALIGHPYDAKVDIWSTACIVFELLTGDYLFEPRRDKRGRYEKDDDHAARMIELLGPMPKWMTTGGKYQSELFTREGKLKRIDEKDLEYWPLCEVLHEKYRFPMDEAQRLSDFLLPMLAFEPDKRCTAAEALKHPWLEITELDRRRPYLRGLAPRKKKKKRSQDEEENNDKSRAPPESPPAMDVCDDESDNDADVESDNES
ncbi:MAG: hypothetical protein MHM6MM_000169 [Cercozoa sp. M6MM]